MFVFCVTFRYIAILVFCQFGCKMPNHAHFLGDFGVPDKKKAKQNSTVQYSTGKKSQKCNISPMCGEAPVKDIATKFFTGIDVDDVVMHAKFESENLRGSDFTGGRILAFSIDFAYGP